MIRGIRGAITVRENTEVEIVSASKKLMEEVIRVNGISPESVASVFVSVTADLTAAFPAKALRQIDGWTHVPVMCMQEIPVPSALPMCVRVMFHANTVASQKEVKHVYLAGAEILRPDLLKLKVK